MAFNCDVCHTAISASTDRDVQSEQRFLPTLLCALSWIRKCTVWTFLLGTDLKGCFSAGEKRDQQHCNFCFLPQILWCERFGKIAPCTFWLLENVGLHYTEGLWVFSAESDWHFQIFLFTFAYSVWFSCRERFSTSLQISLRMGLWVKAGPRTDPSALLRWWKRGVCVFKLRISLILSVSGFILFCRYVSLGGLFLLCDCFYVSRLRTDSVLSQNKQRLSGDLVREASRRWTAGSCGFVATDNTFALTASLNKSNKAVVFSSGLHETG